MPYQNNETFLMIIVFLAVFLIAGLMVLVARYILVANQKEKELIKSQRLTDAILDSTKYMMIATDPKGKILRFNKQAEIMIGYYEQEILNRMIPRKWLQEEEYLDKYESLKKEFPEAQMNFDVFAKRPARDGIEVSQWNFVRKGGEVFPVRLTVTPMFDAHKRISGYLGMAEDLSDWHKQQTILKESEKVFRSAMEQSSVGKALVQLDGRWLKVNQALCDMLGYSEEEFLKTDFQRLTHPEDLRKDLDEVNKLLDVQSGSYQIEKRYIKKDGGLIWGLLTVSLALNEDNSPKYFISQIQDITERKRVEAMKNEFVSVVSHELRTPLTAIRGSLGLVEGTMAAEIPGKVLKLVSLANKNSERLLDLINDILDLDKIAAGEMYFDIKGHPLTGIVRQAIEANRPYADSFQVKYRLEEPVEDILVAADDMRLMQVLTNLLSNAAKFSPENEEVVISIAKGEGMARVEVKDKGPGVPQEFHSRIFDKFSQADSSATRLKGGTGLGLHISKMLMERMNGDIGFVSLGNSGTTFWIDIPLGAHQ